LAEIIDESSFRNRTYVFDDRFHAGELLAQKLKEYVEEKDVLVLAIPAGGIEVAAIVAKRLGFPLDVVITRKIHIPWNKEAGFGAVSWDGTVFFNEPLISDLGLSKEEIDRCVAEEKEVIKKRLKKFRGDKHFPDLKDKTAIIVDDGLASGFSMLTTVKTIRRREVKAIVVAVPTAPDSAIELIRPHVNRIVCLNIRSGQFFAVADAYKVWYDLEDKDVMRVLKQTKLYN
jgi:predicted phosphoribosyltransferase